MSQVTLYAFPKHPNAPSASGFCQKLETFLRYTNTPHTLAETFPNKAPKGKLPYAEIPNLSGGVDVVPDSHFIIQHLIENRISSDPDILAELTPAQIGESRAWQAYFEEKLYLAIVYERWLIPANFHTLSDEVFISIPWFIRPFIEWRMLSNVKTGLKGHGMGRHTSSEVFTIQKQGLEALEAMLDSSGTKWFHGDQRPSTIDLIIFAFLVNTLGTGANPHWRELLLEKRNVVNFVKRFMEEWFPEYEGLLKEVTEVDRRLRILHVLEPKKSRLSDASKDSSSLRNLI